MKRPVLAAIVRAWAEAAPGCYLLPCQSYGERGVAEFDVCDPATAQPFATLIVSDDVWLDAMEPQPPLVQARLDAALARVRWALEGSA